MNERADFQLPLDAIRAYCKQRPIERLSLFGSALRDDFSPESDIDLLVEYAPGAGIGFSDMMRQESDFSELVGRSVDLRTPQELSPHFRQEVVDSAEPLYDVAGIPERRRKPMPPKPEKDRARLLHMLEAAEEAIGIASDYTQDDIENIRMLALALTKAVEIIGEAANHVSADTRELAPEIDWKDIIGMRHRPVYDYARVNYDVLWDVVTEKLPPLISDLRPLIQDKYGDHNG